MRIAKKVEVLELEMNMMGRLSVIHPTLLWDDNEIILVDTGIPDGIFIYIYHKNRTSEVFTGGIENE